MSSIQKASIGIHVSSSQPLFLPRAIQQLHPLQHRYIFEHAYRWQQAMDHVVGFQEWKSRQIRNP